MRALATMGLLFMLICWSSCEDGFETIESSGALEFSKDTVFLDTIFTRLSSSTYSLKVYNRSGEDIHIPEVSLERGESSSYRLNVDGVPGKKFENVVILARDSIYIFIETTVDSEGKETQFLYRDQLLFKSKNHVQEIPLISLVKEAQLLFPSTELDIISLNLPANVNIEGREQKVQGFILKDEHLNLNNEKAVVIFGYAVVPPGKQLRINAGSRLHFSAGSGLVISEGASLLVSGDYSEEPVRENEVIFEGDRPETIFENIPGQWGMIWFQNGSASSHLEHLSIRNSTVGLFIEEPAAGSAPHLLQNLQIYNSALAGIEAVNSKITAENMVINNSGKFSLHLMGGNYKFRHCTFANYWRQSIRSYPAVYLENETDQGPSPLDVEIVNSIIYGNEPREFGLSQNSQAAFALKIRNSLIKFSSPENPGTDLLDFSNPQWYENIFLNEEPAFVNPLKNDLRLLENSSAIDKGNLSAAQLVPLDLLRRDRTAAPDSGAYEFFSEPSEAP